MVYASPECLLASEVIYRTNTLQLSIVIPARDEKGNIEPLAKELVEALPEPHYTIEIIYVDDGSTDGTLAEIKRLKQQGYPQIRAIHHAKSVGQSGAICSGVAAARFPLIITLDADGQNDPADIAVMLEQLPPVYTGVPFCLAGYRWQRKDTAWKRFQSIVANGVRSRILRDETPDTGCGLKVFPRSLFLSLPQFDHMHRFIPALVRRAGGQVIVVPVSHRDRREGTSKYNLWNRLWVGIVDMLGVAWLQRRNCLAEAVEVIE